MPAIPKMCGMVLLLLLCMYRLNAQTQQYIWAKSMRGNNNDIGASVTVDAAGNVYTSGSYMNTMDADPGTGVYNLTNSNPGIYVLNIHTSGIRQSLKIILE